MPCRRRSPSPCASGRSTACRPNPGGWITTTARNAAIDRLRRESRGRELLTEVAVLSPGRRRSRHARGSGTRAGRPASPHLHLLPSGALHGSAGGADPASARRPVDGRGRPRLPGRRADHGPTAGARQAQDQGGADPLPRAGGSRAARPPPPGAGRRLPHLQRRADRPSRTGSVRRGDPAGADPGDADARRAGGGRPVGAVAPHRIPSLVAHGPRRLPRAARRAGPHTMGSRPDRGGPSDRARGAFAATNPVRISSRRPSTPCMRTPPTVEETDWSQIVALYDQLLGVAPTPVVALNRAIAIGEVEGPAAALALVDALDLDNYYPFHATRADLLRRLGPTRRGRRPPTSVRPPWRRRTPSGTS